MTLRNTEEARPTQERGLKASAKPSLRARLEDTGERGKARGKAAVQG